MGLYPSFIKTKAVLAADVHPFVFQLYKSSIVFLTGWMFLIPRAIHAHSYNNGTRVLPADESVFVFSIWGALSAAFWVPSGILTISSVPLIGMGMQVAVSSASASLLSFLVFWLVFDTPMKKYPTPGGGVYYRAPIYLVATIMGMVMLVFAEKIAIKIGIEKKKEEKPIYDSARSPLLNINNEAEDAAPKKTGMGVFLLGIILSIFCGVFAAGQFGVITVAKKSVYTKNHCENNHKDCPDNVTEAFDNFVRSCLLF